MAQKLDIPIKNTIFVRNTTQMYTAVKGIYEKGVLKLLEPAPNVDKSEVLVTFLSESKKVPAKKRKPGGLLRLSHLKGKKIAIPANFNDPLDEMRDYM